MKFFKKKEPDEKEKELAAWHRAKGEEDFSPAKSTPIEIIQAVFLGIFEAIKIAVGGVLQIIIVIFGFIFSIFTGALEFAIGLVLVAAIIAAVYFYNTDKKEGEDSKSPIHEKLLDKIPGWKKDEKQGDTGQKDVGQENTGD